MSTALARHLIGTEQWRLRRVSTLQAGLSVLILSEWPTSGGATASQQRGSCTIDTIQIGMTQRSGGGSLRN